MFTAEELYQTSDTDFSSTEDPPIWLDSIFIIIISCIHIVYIFKFSTFSLSYLKAKCDEKASNCKWSESKLYLAAVLSHKTRAYTNINVDDYKYTIYTKLWVQLSLIRNIVRILLFVCCAIILVLYLSFVINICFEYFVVCILNEENGSFLALAILPFLWFINCTILRFMIFGMMAAWSMNVDTIADRIACQQNHKSLKQYAHNDEQDDEERVITETENEKSLKHAVKGFASQYFMAFHWRLLTVACSVIATIFAIPTIQDKNALTV